MLLPTEGPYHPHKEARTPRDGWQSPLWDTSASDLVLWVFSLLLLLPGVPFPTATVTTTPNPWPVTRNPLRLPCLSTSAPR